MGLHYSERIFKVLRYKNAPKHFGILAIFKIVIEENDL